ncbi:MAG: hypothetical protein RLZZ31_937 [Actinomycetota bacterium]
MNILLRVFPHGDGPLARAVFGHAPCAASSVTPCLTGSINYSLRGQHRSRLVRPWWGLARYAGSEAVD